MAKHRGVRVGIEEGAFQRLPDLEAYCARVVGHILQTSRNIEVQAIVSIEAEAQPCTGFVFVSDCDIAFPDHTPHRHVRVVAEVS